MSHKQLVKHVSYVTGKKSRDIRLNVWLANIASSKAEGFCFLHFDSVIAEAVA